MLEQYKEEPKSVYHYTKKTNIDSIKKDRQLKKLRDLYVFSCITYEDCIFVIKNTILNPKAKFIDFDGIAKPYEKIDVNDYVILKCKPRFSKVINWYISSSARGISDINQEINGKTLAYKGNLPVDIVDIMKIVL